MLRESPNRQAKRVRDRPNPVERTPPTDDKCDHDDDEDRQHSTFASSLVVGSTAIVVQQTISAQGRPRQRREGLLKLEQVPHPHLERTRLRSEQVQSGRLRLVDRGSIGRSFDSSKSRATREFPTTSRCIGALSEDRSSRKCGWGSFPALSV